MNKKAMQAALNELNNTITQLSAAGACEELLGMLEAAGTRLELEIEKAEKRWYLFDKHDCIGDYERAVTAAAEAQRMADDGDEGVHMLYLTKAEKDAYCEYGIAALKGVIGN